MLINKYILFGVVGLIAALIDIDCVCTIGLNIGLSLSVSDVTSDAIGRSITIHYSNTMGCRLPDNCFSKCFRSMNLISNLDEIDHQKLVL